MNNSVLFIGRVDRDPRTFALEAFGRNVVRFSVATTELQFVEPRWIEVQSSSDLGERALAMLSKGTPVAMQGKLALSSPAANADGLLVTKPFIELSHFQIRDDCS